MVAVIIDVAQRLRLAGHTNALYRLANGDLGSLANAAKDRSAVFHHRQYGLLSFIPELFPAGLP